MRQKLCERGRVVEKIHGETPQLRKRRDRHRDTKIDERERERDMRTN